MYLSVSLSFFILMIYYLVLRVKSLISLTAQLLYVAYVVATLSVKSTFFSVNIASRPYTRQCLPNASVATVGPTLGPNASLRAIRQKREMETRGDQDNQDKSDLQGKIQFYQQFSASQQKPVAERKTKLVGHSQPAGNETATRTNPCQFSTFKSSPSRAAAPDATSSLDLAGLSLGHRELGPKRAELNPATSRDYYQPMGRARERSPNAASRQLDKQSYFFHGHKTEKDVDREVVMFEDLGTDDCVLESRRGGANNVVETAAASGGSMNCFGGPERGYTDYSDKKLRYPASSGVRRLTMAYEMRRDSGNVEFLEKEGEIFKKSSSELLQEASTSKRRNFSFRNKEKTHRSLESLERSVDAPAMDCKSLDLLPEDRPKAFFHIKQRSLDSSQKSTKKSVDSVANKTRKRPSFFQRVGRSLHFLPREREKCQDLLKPEESRVDDSQYPQTDQKCEYFLQRRQKDVVDFFERTPSLLVSRAPAQFNLGNPPDRYDDNHVDHVDGGSILCRPVDLKQLQEESTFRVMRDLDDLLKNYSVPGTERDTAGQTRSSMRSVRSADDSAANNEQLLVQSRLLEPVASVATQETVSGNKDSLEIGYSISQLGRLYLQNLQHVGRTDGGLQSLEAADVDVKRERYMEWITRDDLDALSHGTNSSDSLAHGKPQGNLDILKGILLDIFVCICI